MINPFIEGIDLFPELLRVQIQAITGYAIERGIQHTDNLGGFIIDDGGALPIPQHRHSNTCMSIRIGPLIDTVKVRLVKKMIAGAAGKIRPEGPAVIQHIRMHHTHTDVVLQLLQPTEDQRPVGPGAGVGHVEVVATRRRLEPALARRSGCAVRRHPVSKLRGLADEFAARGGRVVPAILPLAVNQKSHDSVS